MLHLRARDLPLPVPDQGGAMPSPWIEFHPAEIKKLQKFRDFRIKMGWSTIEGLGFLGSLWGEVMELAEDGDITGWTPAYVADLTGVSAAPGKLWEALVACGWIDEKEGKALVHDWLDYASRYLETRYRTANPERLVAIWATHGRAYQLSPKQQEYLIKRRAAQSDYSQTKAGPPDLPSPAGTCLTKVKPTTPIARCSSSTEPPPASSATGREKVKVDSRGESRTAGLRRIEGNEHLEQMKRRAEERQNGALALGHQEMELLKMPLPLKTSKYYGRPIMELSSDYVVWVMDEWKDRACLRPPLLTALKIRRRLIDEAGRR